MSPKTLNLQISEQLQAFVEEQVAQGGYDNASEYISVLLEQRRQQQVAEQQLEALLLEGVESGEAIEANEEWWLRQWTEKLSPKKPLFK
jgi:antitoxin ParD1/3/4